MNTNKHNIWWVRLPSSTYKHNNFGDTILPYIYKSITYSVPEKITYYDKHTMVIVGGGSVLHNKQVRRFKHIIIWGAGTLPHTTNNFNKNCTILAVRGKLTRQLLLNSGIECPEVYGDLGLIMPIFYNPTMKQKYKIGIVPHYVDYNNCRMMFANEIKLNIIDPIDDLENVIRNIKTCEYILSSSLHGIILAHAYNIKCTWIVFSTSIDIHGGYFKFRDYYSSVIDIELSPLTITETTTYENLLNMRDYINPVLPLDFHHLMDLCPL